MGRQLELDLSNCELMELPEFIHEASAVHGISAADSTDLDRLPLKALLNLPSLKALECTGCASLLSPPPEIARQGKERTMQFLRAARSSTLMRRGCCSSSATARAAKQARCARMRSDVAAGHERARPRGRTHGRH
eukprot:822356-Rhodomonas_salina.1